MYWKMLTWTAKIYYLEMQYWIMLLRCYSKFSVAQTDSLTNSFVKWLRVLSLEFAHRQRNLACSLTNKILSAKCFKLNQCKPLYKSRVGLYYEKRKNILYCKYLITILISSFWWVWLVKLTRIDEIKFILQANYCGTLWSISSK